MLLSPVDWGADDSGSSPERLARCKGGFTFSCLSSLVPQWVSRSKVRVVRVGGLTCSRASGELTTGGCVGMTLRVSQSAHAC